MSTALYEVAADWGNWGAKVVRDGQAVVIRNVAVPYDGSDDDFRSLSLFGGSANGADATARRLSASFVLFCSSSYS